MLKNHDCHMIELPCTQVTLIVMDRGKAMESRYLRMEINTKEHG